MPHTHDHELEVNGVTKQFILVRDDQGRSMYQVTEDVPQYQPNLRFTQFDWNKGHGQYLFKAAGVYFEGQSVDTTIPGRVCLAPLITEVLESDDTELDSAPVGFLWAEVAGKWLCYTAGKIYIYGTKWTAATTTLVRVQQIVEYNGVLYAARGQATPGTWAAGDEYYTSTDGSTWTVTNLVDCYANGFLIAPDPDGTAENIWKFRTPNQLSQTTNGQAGGTAWGTPNYIGETSNNIINIFLTGDKLYVGKEDGLYWVDSNGGVHAETSAEFKINHSTDNFKYVTSWQTSTYVSLLRGMAEITTAETYRPISPLTDIDNIGKVGDIIGITSEKDWLYVGVDEGTNSFIYKGKEILDNGTLRWTWCPWVYLGTNACATIKVCQHSTTSRYLWFGYGAHTAYVILTDNPTTDSSARFCASGWLRMSYVYGSDPNWDKLWQSAVIETKGGASGETVQIKYRKDTDTSATECVPVHYTNGVHEVNFNSAIDCKRAQFEIHLASDTNTATPEVTYFQVKGTEKPTTTRIYEAYYALGDRPTEKAKTMKTFLRSARTSTDLIKFADLRYGEKTSGSVTGDYIWCVMMPGYPKEVEVAHEKGRQPELAIQVRLQEVSFTIK